MKTQEVKEVKNVFEGSDFEKLPKEVKKELVFLSKETRPKELKKLSSLVSKLLELKNDVANTEPIKNENGEYEKDSIKAFKAVKSELRSFNASIKQIINESKRPYMEINKAFIGVRKAFDNEQTSLMETLVSKFDDYIKEQERIKAEKERKKQEELNRQIEAEKAKAAEQLSEAQVLTKYNQLKYEYINDNFNAFVDSVKVMDIPNAEEILKTVKAYNSLMVFIGDRDFMLDKFSEKQISDVIEKFEDQKSKTIERIEEIIEQKKEEIKNQLEAQKEKPQPVISGINVVSPKEVKESNHEAIYLDINANAREFVAKIDAFYSGQDLVPQKILEIKNLYNQIIEKSYVSNN